MLQTLLTDPSVDFFFGKKSRKAVKRIITNSSRFLKKEYRNLDRRITLLKEFDILGEFRKNYIHYETDILVLELKDKIRERGLLQLLSIYNYKKEKISKKLELNKIVLKIADLKIEELEKIVFNILLQRHSETNTTNRHRVIKSYLEDIFKLTFLEIDDRNNLTERTSKLFRDDFLTFNLITAAIINSVKYKLNPIYITTSIPLTINDKAVFGVTEDNEINLTKNTYFKIDYNLIDRLEITPTMTILFFIFINEDSTGKLFILDLLNNKEKENRIELPILKEIKLEDIKLLTKAIKMEYVENTNSLILDIIEPNNKRRLVYDLEDIL